ncbi:Sodium-coupled neutral amino acid transporter 2 [Wickerhamomyces ciferrii]|uniref:Sodium-coupled neutral amino acid transporter 2 n=1 Tax=Wickerhamomyces ciferrii (strain ATCC 14091 / BCRC 22168 / CBS 111 / JCM 3599 / NBRC 0793 / NRRL Y-1031 F-60-10) TaxID=1206466 RepID=K0KPG6_WICCF|nr:Sodium-coupled neutral amino acid transporter 2 [Wickerhamomyces ciferrii]CCH44072.1 Sodium-coupled neutral amino acid transporter 2 [Wickerhamomyces ciferrii]
MSKVAYTNVPQNQHDDDENLQDNDSLEIARLDSFDYETQDITIDHEDTLEDLETFQLPNLNGSNLKMAFMNMANSILGAGAIGVPFAISNTGILGGIIALIILTILVDFTLRLIIINMKLAGKNGYQETVDHCFGKWGKVLIIAAQGLFAYGGSIGFCIIIGDTIPHILRSFFPNYADNGFLRFLFARNTIIILVTAFISFPLSLSKDISKLAKASALALVSMLVIITVVLVRGPMLPAESKGTLTTEYFLIRPSFFQGVSVISFALVCHHNTAYIFHSLKKPSLNRFSLLTHLSCLVSLVALALIGFGGFGAFKSATKGNVLNNFPGNDLVVNIARFCFGFNMLTTYPLEIFVLRDVLRDLWYINQESAPPMTYKSHFLYTLVLVIFTMGISLMTCNLGALFELIGASTASAMAYIIPPMCHLKMTGSSKTWLQKSPYIGTIAFGFAVMFISSTQTIIAAVKQKDSSHCAV